MKLTLAQVQEIKAAPGIHREIAARYGIASGYVCQLKKGSRDVARRIGREPTHGDTRFNDPTSEYRIWGGMKRRCLDKKHPYYRHYGGRGITIYPEWINSYESFLSYMGRRPSPDHSIDRIDNDRGYEPGNVRWATVAEQARNRRTNRLETLNGETKTVFDWAKSIGMSPHLLYSRLNMGWSLSKALQLPPGNLRYLTYQGETKRVYEWAKSTGIALSTLTNRLDVLHWDVDKTLSTPIRAKYHHKGVACA